MRIRSLDALRGVAALVVVFHHCSLTLDQGRFHHLPFHGGTTDFWAWMTRTPLCILIDGPAAVLIFFALSGLVLAKSMEGTRDTLPTFYVKRFTRIWLPFAAALSVAAVLFALVGGHTLPAYSQWFNERTWAEPFSGGSFLRQINLLDGGSTQLDNPAWSLVHEARISVVFPAIAAGAAHLPILTAIIGLALLPAAMVLHHGGWLLDQIGQTSSYAFLFVFGAILGTRIHLVRDVLGSVPRLLRRVAWPVLLGILVYAPYMPNAAGENWKAMLHLLVPGLAAVALVALCCAENIVTRQLERPVPTWLGKISYNLYLIHVPIIAALAHGLPTLSPVVIVSMAIPISLGSAHVLHLAVERPSKRLGRVISTWVDGQTPGTDARRDLADAASPTSALASARRR